MGVEMKKEVVMYLPEGWDKILSTGSKNPRERHCCYITEFKDDVNNLECVVSFKVKKEEDEKWK